MRGCNNTFLGMNKEINYNRTQLDRFKQLEECKESFGVDVSTLITSQATNKCFEKDIGVKDGIRVLIS